MDEGRKRVIGLMAAILSAIRIIEASIQWAERIIRGSITYIPGDVDKDIVQRISPRVILA